MFSPIFLAIFKKKSWHRSLFRLLPLPRSQVRIPARLKTRPKETESVSEHPHFGRLMASFVSVAAALSSNNGKIWHKLNSPESAKPSGALLSEFLAYNFVPEFALGDGRLLSSRKK
jgi:hypothetical protein